MKRKNMCTRANLPTNFFAVLYSLYFYTHTYDDIWPPSHKEAIG